MQATEEDVNLIRQWLSPEWFPIYYEEQASFMIDTVQSGAVSATATLAWKLSDYAHVWFGVRISNTYPIPSEPTEEELALLSFLKGYWDQEQTIKLTTSQQNVTGATTPILQPHVTGRTGIAWAPFPKPYLFRGGNQITAEVRRLQGYPLLHDAAILPVCRATLVMAVARKDVGIASGPGPRGSTGRPA